MLADDCAALLDLLGIEAADFVGLSLGGMVGQAFALRHPNRLRRLVLANTSSGYGPEAHVLWDARKKLVREGGMRAIRELAVTRGFSEPISPGASRGRGRRDGAGDGLPGGRLRRVLRCDRRARPHGATAAHRGAHAVHRRQPGRGNAGRDAARHRRGHPRSAARRDRRRGHISVVEKPEAFARLVREFLEV
jgi:3-oxoadipate enol-lactonase